MELPNDNRSLYKMKNNLSNVFDMLTFAEGKFNGPLVDCLANNAEEFKKKYKDYH